MRKKMMTPSTSLIEDHSALTSTSKGGRPSKGHENTKRTKIYSHYGRKNHSVDFCWELHPEKKPVKFKNNKKNQPTSSNAVVVRGITPNQSDRETKSEIVNLFVGDLACPQHILSQMHTSSSTSPGASTAYVNSSFGDSTGGMALNITSPSSPAWVLDSDATDHMTGNSSLFFSYIFGSGQEKVTIADSFQSIIAEKGVV